MDRRPRIVVVGSTMVDLIAYAVRAPQAGETVFGDDFRIGFGGKGANQAVMARLLGADVAMVNALGDDVFGEMTLANFAELGIDASHVRRVPGASGVAPIWVEADGTNRIIVVPGANAAMTPGEAVTALKALAEAGPVHAVMGQLEIPQAVTAAAFAAARGLGATTVLNPAPAALLDPALLAATDWLIPNEVEFARLAGSAPDDAAIAAYGRATAARLVVTLGESGAAVLKVGGSVRRIAAPRVTAVDTTGAGDAFIGAFAYGLAAGESADAAVALGIACASDSVLRPGTQSSFPRGDRAAQLLAGLAGPAGPGPA